MCLKGSVPQLSDQLSVFVAINSLLRHRMRTYNFCSFLSKVLLKKSKDEWIERRQRIRSEGVAFKDLRYLQNFIEEEEGRLHIRCSTMKKLNSETMNTTKSGTKLPFLPKKTPSFSGSQSKMTENPCPEHCLTKMEMSEFLVHMNLQMQMNLDHSFLTGVREIINFFASMESFMIDSFGNADLEVKIDMMRLVIRMTNAKYFVDKVYMLDLMGIDYLLNWQTFALFVEVLRDEVKIPRKRGR